MNKLRGTSHLVDLALMRHNRELHDIAAQGGVDARQRKAICRAIEQRARGKVDTNRKEH